MLANEVLSFIEENDVKFIRLAFTDLFGQLRNTAILPDQLAAAMESGVAIDVELELPDGAGIKLAELFDEGNTVLAKGFTGVCLMGKDEVRAMDHRYQLS